MKRKQVINLHPVTMASMMCMLYVTRTDVLMFSPVVAVVFVAVAVISLRCHGVRAYHSNQWFACTDCVWVFAVPISHSHFMSARNRL